jgi:cyanophycin synthetase
MTRPPREPDLASGFPSPTIVDSRRLMGPNLMHAGVGAVLDVTLDPADARRGTALIDAWQRRVAIIASALGWPDADTVVRRYAGGASLFVHAPVDQLMTATDVCESAWVLAEDAVNSAGAVDVDAALLALRACSEAEALPPLRAIWSEAQRSGLNVTFDDDEVFVGSGATARGWPRQALPRVSAVDWRAIHDIPIVLVTGSNGKTTVVRMVAAMARAAGHVVGYTCTDGVWIGDERVETGDWSGPAGARRVLRDPTVTLAVLETARGGVLRRGLAVQHAAVAAIVTLSPDHFGDYGITDLATLAQVKLVVARPVRYGGMLVVNGDVPVLRRALASYDGLTRVVFADGDAPMSAADLAAIPATLGGAATHNVLNAKVALAIAEELGLDAAARSALLTFGADPHDNMGRLMLHDVGGITVVVDYAHNPQGVTALVNATRHLPAKRRAIALGTGGDRDDGALRDIAAAAVDTGAIDFYIAKEMPHHRRGRDPGAISAVLLAALAARGVPAAQLASAPDDIAAARLALQWAQSGDLILLPVHADRDAVLACLAELARMAWRAGDPLPERRETRSP